MIMSPPLRKVVLTLHVTTSLGWLGAVAAYVALDVAALTGQDVQTVRSAYLAMEMIAWYVVVPLALASALIGLINALGTSWGLLRHYWVVVKFLLALLAAAVLLVETRTISSMADAAAVGADPRDLPGTLPHSVGGLVVLVVITILSVFKPRGLTRYGWRKQEQQRRDERAQRPVSAEQ
ncbi:hypothetical protein AB0K02_26840 [Streptomyces sp. NPDC049597]|uniref:hypothetical protein n=1 Tax=Streptomyces sp. NPDC049597 TaxID=3155276 RepID=UPI003419F254